MAQVTFTTRANNGSERGYTTFREAELAAKRRFHDGKLGKIYSRVDAGLNRKQYATLGEIVRLPSGKLGTDLTWEGCKYA
jgi:hypothetical protein